jgi:hypothetical protein
VRINPTIQSRTRYHLSCKPLIPDSINRRMFWNHIVPTACTICEVKTEQWKHSNQATACAMESTVSNRAGTKLGFWKFQPSLDISPIWIPLISYELINSQGRSVWSDRFFMGFYKVLVPSVQFFYSKDGTSGRHLMVSQHYPINHMHWFSWTWFVN